MTVEREPETPVPLVVAIDATAGDDAAAAALTAVGRALAEASDRIVVIRGRGAGFIVADAATMSALRDLVVETAEAIGTHPLPVVACIEAPLVDTGVELALACDLRFVQRGTPVGFPAVTTGWLPCGGTQRLIQEAGSSAAAQLLLLATTWVAGEDGRLDRFLQVDDEPFEAAWAAALALADRAPLALEALKVALGAGLELPLAAGAAIEADLASLLLSTADRAEGLRAFGERRKPRFRGV